MRHRELTDARRNVSDDAVQRRELSRLFALAGLTAQNSLLLVGAHLARSDAGLRFLDRDRLLIGALLTLLCTAMLRGVELSAFA